MCNSFCAMWPLIHLPTLRLFISRELKCQGQVTMLATMSALLVMLALLSPALGVTLVQEVFLGDTVQLRCPSNDDNHRFQFWRLQRENLVIGPTNKYNRDKFRYTVIDGTLTIRGVSSNEYGLYTCVCKHLTDESFNSDDVELIVRRAWVEQEADDGSNHVESYDELDQVLWMKNLGQRWLGLSQDSTLTDWTRTCLARVASTMSVWWSPPIVSYLPIRWDNGTRAS